MPRLRSRLLLDDLIDRLSQTTRDTVDGHRKATGETGDETGDLTEKLLARRQNPDPAPCRTRSGACGSPSSLLVTHDVEEAP